jgi:hypothetical protein
MIDGSDCVSLASSIVSGRANGRIRGSSKRSVAKELRQAIIVSDENDCGFALRA